MSKNLCITHGTMGDRICPACTPIFDSSCKKCGAKMKPLGRNVGDGPINQIGIKVTGYLCDCGHWNNLKVRKGWKEQTEV